MCIKIEMGMNTHIFSKQENLTLSSVITYS